MTGVLNALIGASGGGVVTVSGETISDGGITSPITAGVQFNADGTVDKLESDGVGGVTATQIDTATDWIVPNAQASGAYEIHCHVDAGALSAGSASVDTWLALSSDRKWWCQDTTVNGSAVTATITIQIRRGGTVLDSGVFSLSASLSGV